MNNKSNQTIYEKKMKEHNSENNCPYAHHSNEILDKFILDKNSECPFGFSYKECNREFGKNNQEHNREPKRTVNEKSKNKCPYGYTLNDLDNFVLDNDSKCPYNFKHKKDNNCRRCPNGYTWKDIDKFIVGPNSKCPYGFKYRKNYKE